MKNTDKIIAAIGGTLIASVIINITTIKEAIEANHAAVERDSEHQKEKVKLELELMSAHKQNEYLNQELDKLNAKNTDLEIEIIDLQSKVEAYEEVKKLKREYEKEV